MPKRKRHAKRTYLRSFIGVDYAAPGTESTTTTVITHTQPTRDPNTDIETIIEQQTRDIDNRLPFHQWIKLAWVKQAQRRITALVMGKKE